MHCLRISRLCISSAYTTHILQNYVCISRCIYIVYALQYTKIVSILRCIHDAYRKWASCMHLEIQYFRLKMHVLFIHLEIQTQFLEMYTWYISRMSIMYASRDTIFQSQDACTIYTFRDANTISRCINSMNINMHSVDVLYYEIMFAYRNA